MGVTPINSVNIKGRNYSFHSQHTGVSVSVQDTATPWIKYLARTFPKEFTKALGSVGWWLRREIQNAAYEENPPGANWPHLSDIQRMRTLDDVKRERLGKSRRDPATHAFGKLVKAVGYKRDKAAMRVDVGWLSAAAAKKAYHLQAGFTTPVTPKMRRFFAAAGLAVPQGKTIRTEGRELIRPVFQANRQAIFDRIDSKISSYLARSSNRFGKVA